jgi:hypothetical protein
MGAFNAVMRVVSSLIGLVMVLMGAVWILQGLDLAFRVGFMVGQRRWVLFGAILALVGLAQIVWSNIRQSSRSTMQNTNDRGAGKRTAMTGFR